MKGFLDYRTTVPDAIGHVRLTLSDSTGRTSHPPLGGVCPVSGVPNEDARGQMNNLERRAVVDRWQTAFGFLRDLQSGAEVFAHRFDVAGHIKPPIGATVAYRMTVDARGRQKAVDVYIVSPPEDQAPNDERRTGRLVRWFPGRHFGFVETFDGSSYFLHGKDLDLPHLAVVGARVIFTLAPGRHGDDVAVRARLVRERDGNR